jgi:antitoxin component YwqK of YwqJK toxin-antitoxin module
MTRSVDFEVLEPSDDYLTMLYEGRPFSGLAYEKNPAGSLVSECTFKDGQKFGISREYASTGVLVEEKTYEHDALHGPSHEWYENGVLKSEGEFEFGICLWEKMFGEDGLLIREFTLAETAPQFKTLQKLRLAKPE